MEKYAAFDMACVANVLKICKNYKNIYQNIFWGIDRGYVHKYDMYLIMFASQNDSQFSSAMIDVKWKIALIRANS